MALLRAETWFKTSFTSDFTVSTGVEAKPVRTKEERTTKNAEENFISIGWRCIGECCRTGREFLRIL